MNRVFEVCGYMSNEGMFKLDGSIDGEIVDKIEFDDLGDILNVLYNFQRRLYDKYNFDCNNDVFIVRVNFDINGGWLKDKEFMSKVGGDE